MYLFITDPLTTLASAAIFSAPPPTSTVVGGSDMKQDLDDLQMVTRCVRIRCDVIMCHIVSNAFAFSELILQHLKTFSVVFSCYCSS
jgi:hypothetical protein